MQYLLTQTEYTELRWAANRNKRQPDHDVLQDFCTRVANELPVKVRCGSEVRTRPWGCVITNGGYCDQCPAKEVCPHDGKGWSK